MKKIILFIIACTFCYLRCDGQESSDKILKDAQFALIKNAAIYYASDSAISKWKSVQRGCEIIEDEKNFINCFEKNLPAGKANIEEWSTRLIEDTGKLKKLSDDITKGIHDKNPKRDFSTGYYISFEANAGKILKDAREKIKPSINTGDSLGGTSSVSTPPKGGSDEQATSAFSLWLFIPIGLALIAGVFIWLLGKSVYGEIDEVKRELKKQINTVNANLQQNIAALEKEMRSFDGSIDGLREDLLKKINNIKLDLPAVEPTIPKMTVSQPIYNQPGITYKYAKYADMGDSFSLASLSDEEDSEKVFEIKISQNGTAKFKVVSNMNAQLLALSNPILYFGKTCKYDSMPSHNSTIQNEVEGELKLQGNKWKIITPAKISFF